MNGSEDDQGQSHVHSSNSSYFKGASSMLVDVLLCMTISAIVLLTVCGNLFVMISICHFKQLHTPTNVLLLSLAMADFFVGLTVMPFYFIMLIESHLCVNAVYCTIWNVSCYCLICVSIYNVAFIAVDRYFALCNPFLYSSKMTVNLTLRIISILWLCSLIYNVVLLHFNGKMTPMTEKIVCADKCFATFNIIWSTVDFIIVFIVPCMAIIITYLKIFAIAKKHANTIMNDIKQHNANGTKTRNGYTTSERKAGKTLGILVSVFLLCLVPYYISAFLDAYTRNPYVYLAILSTSPLVHLNSFFNPIIYALFYPWFQKSVKLILTCKIFSSGSSLINVLSKT